MKTSWKVLVVDLLLVGLVGLVLAEEKPSEKAPPKAATPQKVQTVAAAPAPVVSSPAVAAAPAVTSGPDLPVIGYIERRGQTITIKSGAKGPVYSVRTTDGKVVFDNLSAEQLSAKAPELHEFIKTAVAGKGAPVDSKVRVKKDARLQGQADAGLR